MEVINTEYLKKDSNYIKSLFLVKNNKTIVKEPLKIVFPERFINKNLAVMGSVINVVGVFGIIANNKYATTMVPIMFRTTPSTINEAMIDGVNYIVLEYDKDQLFMDDNNLKQSEGFMYELFEELFLNGNVPWYVDYNSLSKLFLEAKKYAKSKIGDSAIVMELLTALITRDAKDKNIFYRNVVKSNKNKEPYAFVGLSNIYYSYKDTGSKLVGNYLRLGIDSALINKEKEPSKVNALLRS